MVLLRLYAFKRRCGMSRRHSFMSALRAVLRDFQISKVKP